MSAKRELVTSKPPDSDTEGCLHWLGTHVMDWDHQRPPRAARTKSWAYRSGRLRRCMAVFRSSRLTRPSPSRSRLSKYSRPVVATNSTGVS